MRGSVLTPRVIVVSGTGTGVGKTIASAGLARALTRRGRKVVAVKPVESGCPVAPSADEDGALLASATGQPAPSAALLRLREPVAPPLAADHEGVTIVLDELLQRALELAEGAEVLLVEGAGGLLSPLTWSETAVDLARRMDARLLVVALNELGVIHHTRAALRVAEAEGIPLLGVVLSAGAGGGDASVPGNLASLQRLVPTMRFATLPRVGSVESAADAMAGPAGWVEETG